MPALSPATHRRRDGHEIAIRAPEKATDRVVDRSTYADRQVSRPPVGRDELITFPAESTAAQNELDGPETPITAPPAPPAGLAGSTRTALHPDAPPVGSVETNNRAAANATHNDTDTHETPRNPPA